MTRTEMLYNFKNISNGEPIAALRHGTWKYIKYIKYLRQGSWKYISHINGFDGWNPAPEDTFEECTSCEEELRANPSHFNQLFDLATDPLEEVFSPKIVNPILVYYLFYSTRAFFCYHHTISAQLG